MILDDLQNAARYAGIHPGFGAAFEQLRREDLTSLPVGRHPIDGDRLVLLVDKDQGRGRAEARLEAHRRYIDIQFPISGSEEIGWRPTADCCELAEPYREDRDIMFFADAPTSWLALPPGAFAVFFPEDAHAPLAGVGMLHKAILKVAVDR